MSIQSLDAIGAYARSAGITGPPAGGAKPAGTQDAKPDFGKMVESAVSEAANTVKASEAVSRQAALGQAELVDVVTAVNSAEIAMETVVAVRDKVIGAYQDIMRMPI